MLVGNLAATDYGDAKHVLFGSQRMTEVSGQKSEIRTRAQDE